jgi:ketosteroid isomerase-like protein
MGANLDLIRATYEGTSEENGGNLLAVLAADAEWTEAEGFPYAGTYVGPQAIMAGVFRRLADEWIGYRADVHTYLEDGDRVAAFGVYQGRTRRPASRCTRPSRISTG